MSMRPLSLAYLSVNASTACEALLIAQKTGYQFVGLRLQPNTPGAPFQHFITEPKIQAQARAIMADTGMGVFDIEIIRIGETFNPKDHEALLAAGQSLSAKAVLVAADDSNVARLSEHFAQLCEFMRPFALTANLEFMPWTGVKDIKAAIEVINKAAKPSNAGILIDSLHFGRSASTLEDIDLIPQEWLHYAQVADATAGQHFSVEEMIHTAREERLLPGEGNIDIQGIFSRLDRHLPTSVEIPHFKRSRAMGDPAWAQLAYEATQKMLAGLSP